MVYIYGRGAGLGSCMCPFPFQPMVVNTVGDRRQDGGRAGPLHPSPWDVLTGIMEERQLQMALSEFEDSKGQ